MVEMYVWLLVTLAVAVGVLMLAGFLSPGDRDDPEDAAVDAGCAAGGSAWSALWQDFLSATSSSRARLARLREGAAPGVTAPRPTVGRTAGHPRAGQGAAPPAPPAPPAPVTTPRPLTPRPASGRHDRDLAESNTSFEEFFEATATSEPAYLDAAQLSDALHSLRR